MHRSASAPVRSSTTSSRSGGGAGGGSRGGFKNEPKQQEAPRRPPPSVQQQQALTRQPHPAAGAVRGTPPRDIVIFLVNAGLWLGQDGLVDAYDRGMKTGPVNNPSVVGARPDIVHQCLLSIFDSEFGAAGRCRVFIYTTRGKTIEVSPHMRPPRTYDRFKGLMATLLREGKVLANPNPINSGGGENQQQSSFQHQQPLLQILQGSIAPMIPEGADVIGLTNAKYASIATPVAVAEYCHKNPVSTALRGGRKGASAFFCIDCRDEADPSEEPCVTKLVSLSPYPQAPHTQAIRLCEGFQFAHNARAEAKEKQQQQQQQQPAAAAAAATTEGGLRRRQREQN